MADSSGHPNDAGNNTAAIAALSSSDESSSSDDSSEDSSNDREDGARSEPTRPRGKILAFQARFGQGKRVDLGEPSADDSSEDSSSDDNQGANSATTTGRGKILAECYLQPKLGPPRPHQEMLVNVFTLMCSRPMLDRSFQAQKSLMKLWRLSRVSQPM